MTCDDEIVLAIFGGILFWPAMLFWFLFWEMYAAEKIYRLRLRLAKVIRGRL